MAKANVILRLYEDLDASPLNAFESARQRGLFAENYRLHVVNIGRSFSFAEAHTEWRRSFCDAFTNVRHSVREIIDAGSCVSVVVEVTAVHSGNFSLSAGTCFVATGKVISFWTHSTYYFDSHDQVTQVRTLSSLLGTLATAGSKNLVSTS
jgi:hypothetical protein